MLNGLQKVCCFGKIQCYKLLTEKKKKPRATNESIHFLLYEICILSINSEPPTSLNIFVFYLNLPNLSFQKHFIVGRTKKASWDVERNCCWLSTRRPLGTVSRVSL